MLRKLLQHLQNGEKINMASTTAVGARYSILSNAWITRPSACSDQSVILHLAEQKADRVQRTIQAAIELDDQERLESLLERLRLFRSEGLHSDDGVCSVENETYKILRRNGTLNRLKQAALREYDEALSYSCAACEGSHPQRYAKSDWIPYNGPAGGKGWQHITTGRIEYGDQPPGGDDEQSDMAQNEPGPEASSEPDPWDTKPPAAEAPLTPPPPIPKDPNLTPAEQAKQPDAHWHPVKGANGEQLWRHPHTGETILAKEAPSRSKAQEVIAKARAGSAPKQPQAPPPSPAAQPVPAKPAAPQPAEAAKPTPTPAANKPNANLSRTWQSGMSTGTVEFEDADHRDLFDLASKQRRATTASGKVSHASQQKLLQQANGLRTSLSSRLRLDPSQVNNAAQDVYNSAKSQAKGMKDGEHRKLTRTPPQTDSPPDQPQPSAPPAAQPQPAATATGEHPATKQVNAMPDGAQLFGFTKETPKGLGMSVWTNGDDALGTNQLLQEHSTPEHQAELNAALQQHAPPTRDDSRPDESAAGPRHRDYTTEESANVHSAAAIFGIAPGDLGDHRQMSNFLLRTARNVGFTPHMVAGDRTDKTVAAAQFLASRRPHLNAVVQMARGYGWGGGSGRELAHTARHAGLHLIKAAAQRGYDPEGNSEAEHIAGAISFLQQHEQQSREQQHAKRQAVTQSLHDLFNQIKSHAANYLSGDRKITPMDIALACIGFYAGYQMVRRFRRRRKRR